MTILDMVQDAVASLGDVPADMLASHVPSRYGITVTPAMIPFLRASLREREMLARFREEAKELGATRR